MSVNPMNRRTVCVCVSLPILTARKAISSSFLLRLRVLHNPGQTEHGTVERITWIAIRSHDNSPKMTNTEQLAH